MNGSKPEAPRQDHREHVDSTTVDPRDPKTWPREYGGQSGPEPTRYGDWEKGGRCTDF